MNSTIQAGRLAALAIASLCLVALLAVARPAAAQSDDQPGLLVFVTSSDAQTQAMALILAGASRQQGAEVRVLLCGPGGDIALADAPQTKLEPRGATPQGLLQGLLENGATVEVCALYLPNSGKAQSDLLEGVGVAQPPAIATEMLREDVKLFSF